MIINWQDKLFIGDVDIHVLRDPVNCHKEIVISYKTSNINLYTILVLDLHHSSNQPIMYRHESFQLWESCVSGILLSSTNDFLAVNKDGLTIFALGSTQRRQVRDCNGDLRMLHSLASMNYLKHDPANLVVYANQNIEKREVQIKQVYYRENETCMKDIYKIKIHKITLRELLVLQSIYVCKTLSEIREIVQDQPKPLVFYKSFLELNGANMCAVMSFDSVSLTFLLNDSNSALFSEEYPIFYKNKNIKGRYQKDKYCYRNAIDIAIKYDQSRAVGAIINYLVKYQNSYISHFLFLKNLHFIIEKGIQLYPLLQSKIFLYEFDFDEWPQTHQEAGKCMRPYNFSIFDLRSKYHEIFPEPKFRDTLRELDDHMIDSSKVYKIRYRISLIPCFGQHFEYNPQKKKFKL
jgi:hypothetical protein